MSKEKQPVRFNQTPPMCLDLTAEQALEHLEDYLPGGRNFELGTSDIITKDKEGKITSDKSKK